MRLRCISRTMVLAIGVLSGVPPMIAGAKTVTLDIDVELDQVAPENAKLFKIGSHDRNRLAYDDTQVDPVTHKVKLTYLAHFIDGQWMATAPTDASTLDLSSQPYQLNFVAPVIHGRPLLVVFEGATRRMAVLARPDFHMLIAGQYVIGSKPLTRAEASAPPASL